MVAVIPNEMLGENLPDIFEVQAFKMPATIYTGTYPQIKINPETIIDKTDEFKGLGISGILTSAEWYVSRKKEKDYIGVGL